MLPIDRIVPQQLIARAGAVDAERVDDHAWAITFDRRPEQPHGPFAGGSKLEGVGSVGDAKCGVRRFSLGAACGHAACGTAVDDHVELAAAGHLQVVKLEYLGGLTEVAILNGADLAERTRTTACHGDARKPDRFDLRVADADAMRFPSLAIAIDVDVAMTVCAPRMDWHDKPMPGIAIPLLKLAADVPCKKVAGDVGRPIEHQSRLPFSGRGSRECLVKSLHRSAVTIFDCDVEPELPDWRRLQQTRPHAVRGGAHRLDHRGLVDGCGCCRRRCRRVGRTSGRVVRKRPERRQPQPRHHYCEG